MNRLAYTTLFYLAMPLVFLRLLWRSREAPGYRSRWKERLGLFGARESIPGAGPCIVFHAVSVGEVHAVIPLIRMLLAQRGDCRVVMTTSTPTGSARVHSVFPGEVYHLYLPYDVPGAVRRFLRFVRPDALVMMETELWPNLIHYSHAAGTRVLLANARMSEKSRRGYAHFARMSRTMLAQVQGVAAQSEDDGRRLLSLGLAPEKLRITGSMKFDMEIPEELLEKGRELRRHIGAGRPVFIAASTREGEDVRVLKAFEAILREEPRTLLVLVPRHPERFDSAARQCRERGLRLLRRSEQRDVKDWDGVQVLVGDSMGEMMMYYGAADIAFVGGSLVDTGCQNILEPAALGLPVLTGPSLYNFLAISDQLIAAGAQRVVRDEAALAAAVVELLRDPALAVRMSAAAKQVVRENRGATRRILGLVLDMLRETPPALSVQARLETE